MVNSLKEKYHGKTLSTDEVANARNEINKEIEELENIEFKNGKDYLLLKWGTWKSWNTENSKIKILFNEYAEIGQTLSAVAQKNTPRQKQILCEIIDLIDGSIQNDWDGDYYTKQQAKDYIMNYGEETIVEKESNNE